MARGNGFVAASAGLLFGTRTAKKAVPLIPITNQEAKQAIIEIRQAVEKHELSVLAADFVNQIDFSVDPWDEDLAETSREMEMVPELDEISQELAGAISMASDYSWPGGEIEEDSDLVEVLASFRSGVETAWSIADELRKELESDLAKQGIQNLIETTELKNTIESALRSIELLSQQESSIIDRTTAKPQEVLEALDVLGITDHTARGAIGNLPSDWWTVEGPRFEKELLQAKLSLQKAMFPPRTPAKIKEFIAGVRSY